MVQAYIDTYIDTPCTAIQRFPIKFPVRIHFTNWLCVSLRTCDSSGFPFIPDWLVTILVQLSLLIYWNITLEECHHFKVVSDVILGVCVVNLMDILRSVVSLYKLAGPLFQNGGKKHCSYLR